MEPLESTARRHLSLVVSDGAATTSDEMLLHQFFLGHPGAADAIWRRYSPMVRRALSRLLGVSGDLEDITQEVFLRVFARLHTLENQSALRSFVFSIALRVTRWERRRRWIRRKMLFAPEEALPSQSTSDDFEARQAVGRFESILLSLRDADRSAFVLHHIEGLTLVETARALHLPLGTLKRRLSHAVERIHLLVQKDPALTGYLIKTLAEDCG